MFTRLLPRMSLTDDMLPGMGASEWSYVTPYRRDVEVSLRELQQRVFRDGEYYWFWDQYPGERPLPRPETIDGIWETETMCETGTHTILDIDQVLTTTDPPVRLNTGDYATVRPLAAERVLHHFGTERPTRAQFEVLASGSPRHAEFWHELKLRSAGLYVLLYEQDAPSDVGFWGYGVRPRAYRGSGPLAGDTLRRGRLASRLEPVAGGFRRVRTACAEGPAGMVRLLPALLRVARAP